MAVQPANTAQFLRLGAVYVPVIAAA
ncbi:MAG: hypothetical protein RIS85_1392, partial [Pseudomonadota bacterium]